MGNSPNVSKIDTEEEKYYRKLDNLFESLQLLYKNYEENYQKKLASLFQPLILNYQVINEIEKQANKFLASDFNLIGIFSPDENKISDIIVNILEPNGKHGQGNIFLLKFLETVRNEVNNEFIDLEATGLSKVRIYREYVTDKGRRIDIVIELPNDFIIGIENKPWAGEQNKQLEDYSEFLRSISKEKFLLIYLSGYERIALSIDKALKEKLRREGKFLETNYRRFLVPWLEKCYKECRSEKIRWFLLDFIKWIESSFKGGLING
jgi:hypothetical protein